MAKFGYIRLDETDPDVSRQASQLDTIGDYDKIFVDRKTSKMSENGIPEQLYRVLQSMQQGDILYVASLDRLVDSTNRFLMVTDIILSKNAELVCLETAFDTRNSAGKTSLKMIKKLANIDRETMSLKKKKGIKIARQNGKRVGRPPVSIPVGFREICSDWASGKITGVEAIKLSKMKSTTFYTKAYQLGYKRDKSE